MFINKWQEDPDKPRKPILKPIHYKIGAIVSAIAIVILLGYSLIDVTARYNRAVDLFEQGDYERAAEAFEQLGQFRDSTSRYEEAIRAAEENR